MNITPAQHRRYLELCAEYEALVDQARAERARAVAAISQVGPWPRGQGLGGEGAGQKAAEPAGGATGGGCIGLPSLQPKGLQTEIGCALPAAPP